MVRAGQTCNADFFSDASVRWINEQIDVYKLDYVWVSSDRPQDSEFSGIDDPNSNWEVGRLRQGRECVLDSLINSERYVSGQLSELGGDTCGFRFQILNNNQE